MAEDTPAYPGDLQQAIEQAKEALGPVRDKAPIGQPAASAMGEELGIQTVGSRAGTAVLERPADSRPGRVERKDTPEADLEAKIEAAKKVLRENPDIAASFKGAGGYSCWSEVIKKNPALFGILTPIHELSGTSYDHRTRNAYEDIFGTSRESFAGLIVRGELNFTDKPVQDLLSLQNMEERIKFMDNVLKLAERERGRGSFAQSWLGNIEQIRRWAQDVPAFGVSRPLVEGRVSPTGLPGNVEDLQKLAREHPELIAEQIKQWLEEDVRGGAEVRGRTETGNPAWARIKRNVAENAEAQRRAGAQAAGSAETPPAAPTGLPGNLENLQRLAKEHPELIAEQIKQWLEEDEAAAAASGAGTEGTTGTTAQTAAQGAGTQAQEDLSPIDRALNERQRRMREPRPIDGVRPLGIPWKEAAVGFATGAILRTGVRSAINIPLIAAGLGGLPLSVLGGATTGAIIRGAQEIGRQYTEKMVAQGRTGRETEFSKANLKEKLKALKPQKKGQFFTELCIGGVFGALGGYFGYEAAEWVFSHAPEWIDQIKQAISSLAAPEHVLPPAESVPSTSPAPQVPAVSQVPPVDTGHPPVVPPGTPPVLPSTTDVPVGPDWSKDISNLHGAFGTAIQAEVGKYHQEWITKATEELLKTHPNPDQATLEGMQNQMLHILERHGNDVFYSHASEWARQGLTLDQIKPLADAEYLDWITKNGVSELVKGGNTFMEVHSQIAQELARYGLATPVEAGKSIASTISDRLGVDITQIPATQFRDYHLDAILGANLDIAEAAFKASNPGVPFPIHLGDIDYLFDLAAKGDLDAKRRILQALAGIMSRGGSVALGNGTGGPEFLQRVLLILARLK